MTLENVMKPICLFRVRRQLYISNILGQGQIQRSDKTCVSLYAQTGSPKGKPFKGEVIQSQDPKSLHFLSHTFQMKTADHYTHLELTVGAQA